jgi:hypothetical protein
MVRPKTDRTQITLRLEAHTQARAERVRLAFVEKTPHMRGFLPTMPPMLRLLIERGLEAYEAELELEPMPHPKAPSKPRAAGKSRKAG